MDDFRLFARDVAKEASRDVATSNPYVQALCRHRAELHAATVVPAASDQTLEQQLGTQREALGVLKSLRMPSEPPSGKAAGDVVGICCGSGARRACAPPRGPLAHCCVSGDECAVAVAELAVGDTGGHQDSVLHSLPALMASDLLSERSPHSVHSALSTTCTMQSASEEPSSGGIGISTPIVDDVEREVSHGI